MLRMGERGRGVEGAREVNQNNFLFATLQVSRRKQATQEGESAMKEGKI